MGLFRGRQMVKTRNQRDEIRMLCAVRLVQRLRWRMQKFIRQPE